MYARARDRADDRRPALGLPPAAGARAGARRSSRSGCSSPCSWSARRSTAPGAGSRSARPSSSPRSSPSSRSRSGRRPISSRRQAPRTLKQLWRPLGAADLRLRAAARARAGPRHGDRADADARPAMLLVAGTPARVLGAGARDRLGRRLRGDLDRAVPPRALLRVPASAARRRRAPASRSCRR